MKKLLFTLVIVATALWSNAQFDPTDATNSNDLWHNVDNNTAEVFMRGFKNTSGGYGLLRLGRAKGSHASKSRITAEDETIGQIIFQGYTGLVSPSFYNGAAILAATDAALGYLGIPTRLVFMTTPEGSTTLAERMRITNDGKVGIGNDSPLALLDVDGSAIFNESAGNYDFRVESNTSAYALYVNSAASGDEEVVINDDGVSTLNFRVKGNTNDSLFFIDANEDAIGIGCQYQSWLNDGFILNVDGKVRCEELKVYDSGSWGDYVFEDDYDLTELQDVEKYIQENKHLPGIPSAKEIEENGLEVGALIKLQMVKIEELTLHLIKQEKEIAALKTQLNNR